jgi:hypothetical protein
MYEGIARSVDTTSSNPSNEKTDAAQSRLLTSCGKLAKR